jgi:SRSO17 transposase
MKRLLLGFLLTAGAAYAFRAWFGPAEPLPSWKEAGPDEEDLSSDLAQRARQAEGAQQTEETPIT